MNSARATPRMAIATYLRHRFSQNREPQMLFFRAGEVVALPQHSARAMAWERNGGLLNFHSGQGRWELVGIYTEGANITQMLDDVMHTAELARQVKFAITNRPQQPD